MLEVWRGIRRLLSARGEQAPAVSGTKSPFRTREGSQSNQSSRCSPARQRVETRARHQEDRLSSRSAGVACVRGTPRVLGNTADPDDLRKEPVWTQSLAAPPAQWPAPTWRPFTRRLSTETKAACKTTEFITYVTVFARLHGGPRAGQVRQPRALRRPPPTSSRYGLRRLAWAALSCWRHQGRD